jgi:TetR/AcrR family transcriptional regulator
LVNKDQSTEEKILAAAREVFHKRGFDGSRMQDIADTAGINKALLHYYFRNKENLFNAVFTEALSTMVGTVSNIFMGPGSLEEKLERFYDYHITFLQKNSYLPWFIINGLYEKPDQIRELMTRNNFQPGKVLARIVDNLEEEGIEVEEPLQMFANILSLSIFPVVARPMLSHFFNLTDEDMDRFYEERKKNLPRFIINGMKLQNPK